MKYSVQCYVLPIFKICHICHRGVNITMKLVMVWYLRFMTYLQINTLGNYSINVFEYEVLIIIDIMYIIGVAGEQNIQLNLGGRVYFCSCS